MDARFRRKGRRTHIGRLPLGRAIEQIVEGAADAGQLAQMLQRHARLEAIGEHRLQQQRRDDRHEIGVATALADPVQRPLDLSNARIDRR